MLPLQFNNRVALRSCNRQDSLSVAVVGSIVDPIVMHWQNSTIEYDKIDQMTDWTLTLSGVQFWLYDKSTLDVLAKFDNNLKIIKPKEKKDTTLK